MKLSDINLLDVGNKYGLMGAVFGNEDGVFSLCVSRRPVSKNLTAEAQAANKLLVETIKNIPLRHSERNSRK